MSAIKSKSLFVLLLSIYSIFSTKNLDGTEGDGRKGKKPDYSSSSSSFDPAAHLLPPLPPRPRTTNFDDLLVTDETVGTTFSASPQPSSSSSSSRAPAKPTSKKPAPPTPITAFDLLSLRDKYPNELQALLSQPPVSALNPSSTGSSGSSNSSSSISSTSSPSGSSTHQPPHVPENIANSQGFSFNFSGADVLKLLLPEPKPEISTATTEVQTTIPTDQNQEPEYDDKPEGLEKLGAYAQTLGNTISQLASVAAQTIVAPHKAPGKAIDEAGGWLGRRAAKGTRAFLDETKLDQRGRDFLAGCNQTASSIGDKTTTLVNQTAIKALLAAATIGDMTNTIVDTAAGKAKAVIDYAAFSASKANDFARERARNEYPETFKIFWERITKENIPSFFRTVAGVSIFLSALFGVPAGTLALISSIKRKVSNKIDSSNQAEILFEVYKNYRPGFISKTVSGVAAGTSKFASGCKKVSGKTAVAILTAMRHTLEKGLDKKDQRPSAAEEVKPKTPQNIGKIKQTDSELDKCIKLLNKDEGAFVLINGQNSIEAAKKIVSQTNSNGCLVLHFGSIREVNHPIKALSKILDMAWNNNYILIVVGTEYFWPIDPSKNSNLNDLTISNALTSILGKKNGPSIIITAVEPDHAETVCAKFKPQITLQAAQIGQSQKVAATA